MGLPHFGHDMTRISAANEAPESLFAFFVAGLNKLNSSLIGKSEAHYAPVFGINWIDGK